MRDDEFAGYPIQPVDCGYCKRRDREINVGATIFTTSRWEMMRDEVPKAP